MWWIVVIVGVLLFVYYKSKQRKQIVRFSKPTCKYCVDSQAEWDAFKAQALADKSDFEIVDVDISNNSIHTRNWLAKYKVESVPKVMKIGAWGSTEYEGPRISTAYMKFALE